MSLFPVVNKSTQTIYVDRDSAATSETGQCTLTVREQPSWWVPQHKAWENSEGWLFSLTDVEFENLTDGMKVEHGTAIEIEVTFKVNLPRRCAAV